MTSQRYCTHCGTAMETRVVAGNPRLACPHCNSVLYEDAKLVAGGVVLQVTEAGNTEVLLVQRAAEPRRGLWSLPAGYVNRGEVVEEAAVREVEEETGLAVRILGLVGLFSARGDHIVLAAYAMEVVGGALSPDTVEALDARWFPVDALPPLAFHGMHGLSRNGPGEPRGGDPAALAYASTVTWGARKRKCWRKSARSLGLM